MLFAPMYKGTSENYPPRVLIIQQVLKWSGRITITLTTPPFAIIYQAFLAAPKKERNVPGLSQVSSL